MDHDVAVAMVRQRYGRATRTGSRIINALFSHTGITLAPSIHVYGSFRPMGEYLMR